ncbi:MAG: hypothetical protein HZC55_15690 [Verrucomicrobia bacterium]|nr:hypothetical protein [Verrucomicrobiota bacterium]
MSAAHHVCVRLVRWSGWLLLPVVLAFLASGYALSGRYGLAAIASEETALTLHRLLHAPLVGLLGLHVGAALIPALVRWGWLKAAAKP